MVTVLVIALNKISGNKAINDIRSVYPKDSIKDILQWMTEDNLMEYCHKEKILNWLGKQQSNSAEVTRLIKDSVKLVEQSELGNK